MIFNIDLYLISFAVVNVWSYLFSYAKLYSNVDKAEFGILAMVLPLLSFFSKPITCSIADARGAHRPFLIAAVAIFGASYGILGILPFFKKPDDHENDRLAWYVIGFFMCTGYTAVTCVFSLNDALASNYARKHNLNYSRLKMSSNAGWASAAILSMIVGDVSFLPPRVFGCGILFTCTVINIILLTVWPYHEDFEMFHDGTTAEQRKLSIVGPNTLALLAQNRPRGSISWDMLDKIKAGRSKSVGHLPGNTQATLTAKPKQPEEPAKEYTNFQAQMILIKMIATGHKSFFRNICLFITFGMVQGAFNTYQLDYVQQEIANDNKEFEFLSSLCMLAQGILGEMLTNFFATDLVRIFGTNANMSLSLIAIGLRCYFYHNILPFISSYFIVVGEFFQGPSQGLYCILIVEVGSYYALMVNEFMPEMKRKGIVRDRAQEEELNGCLRATMISIMSSSAEGLGYAMGALFGGLVSTSYGYGMMWNACALMTLTIGFINISWEGLTKLILKSSKREEVKQKQMAENLGIPTIVIENAKSRL